MADVNDIRSFTFVTGDLLELPVIRKRRQEAQFWVKDGGFKFLVRVRGLARIDTIKEWQVGDRVVILGHLESHFDTSCHRHVVTVRGVIVTKSEGSGEQWWEKVGLPLVLVNVYQRMAQT